MDKKEKIEIKIDLLISEIGSKQNPLEIKFRSYLIKRLEELKALNREL